MCFFVFLVCVDETEQKNVVVVIVLYEYDICLFFLQPL